MSDDPTVRPGADAAQRRSLWRSIRAISWMFLGVRSSGGYSEDLRRAKPLQVIVIAFIATVLFVLLMAGIAHWVVHR